MQHLDHTHALVTGASSGLGLAIVKALLKENIRITAISRRPPPINDPACRHVKVDLLDDKALNDLLENLQSDLPDLWINNAGFGVLGGLEATDPTEGGKLLKLLLHVPITCAHWYASQLRAKNAPKKACLVQVSSLACEIPIPMMPWYNSVKAGLSAFSASLLLEGNLPFRTIDLRPGDFNTPFIDHPGMSSPAPGLDSYQQRLVRHHTNAPPPEKAAEALLVALRQRRSGIIRTGSFFQRNIAPLGVRLFPQKVLHTLIRRYYKLPPLSNQRQGAENDK